ncbi:surfeit locus 1 family protein [Bathymodiolus japonicus methanotrophic gill symbiont]|uniref:SURF1 family protein n=1 Tax=Bathymodiolus japonicus methanotrophic gill symbiont TaxID=113269 RepID=UPI001B41D1CD|nr:SURF1 family protein [Bathymodiolus japonicus methanotrophic gill symbiont]GFO71997.1 surfeit locus 1 family protein [Bathymodiolus japonicus methanotrophic gill symbiont]
MSRCKIKIVPLIGFIALLALLLRLGFWQLSRAEEKREFLANQTAMMQKQPQPIGQLLADNKPIRYRRVIAKGHYDVQHQILLDNQIHQGKVGYLVLTPFILAHDPTTILVNRGWVLMDKDRSKLPAIDFIPSTEMIAITGVLNEFPQVGLVLKGADQPSEGWPSKLQIINQQKITSKLGRSIADYQLQLAAGEPYGYVREWHVHTRMPPEKHTAYAFQWFALAATLTLLILWISCKTKKHD